MQKQYKGGCHCGAVTFVFNAPVIREGLRCNCSICVKKGALMSNFFLAPDALQITADGASLASYQFSRHIAEHYFCQHCGIYTFHKARRMPGHYRVNLGCVEGVDSLSLPVVLADGAAL